MAEPEIIIAFILTFDAVIISLVLFRFYLSWNTTETTAANRLTNIFLFCAVVLCIVGTGLISAVLIFERRVRMGYLGAGSSVLVGTPGAMVGTGLMQTARCC